MATPTPTGNGRCREFRATHSARQTPLCGTSARRDYQAPSLLSRVYGLARPRVKAIALVASLALSALALVIALGSPDYVWLGWVALLPLFLSIRVFTPLSALLAGAFWGLCLFISLSTALEQEVPLSLVSLALLTTIPAAYTFLGARLTRQVGFSPYLLALGWMGVELGLSPLGLRNGLLSGTQGGVLVIHWMGNFAGRIVVAFLVAYICALVLEAITRVSMGAGVRRFVFGSPDGPRRVFLQTSFSVLFHLIRPAQPRAPPAGLSAQLVRAG